MSALYYLREFALNYHDIFYHPRRYLTPSVELMFFLISTSLFLVFSSLMFSGIFNGQNDIEQTILQYTTFILEVFVALTYRILDERIQQTTIDRAASYTNQALHDIPHAKEVFLSNWINALGINSYTLVERINYATNISHNGGSIFFKRLPSFPSLIYNNQAKQRTVAWLIFLFSIVLYLSKQDGGSLTTVFEFFGDAWPLVAISYIQIIIYLSATMLLVVMIFYITDGIISWFLAYFSNGNYKNDEFLKLLVKDVVEYAAPRWYRE